jgi:hypothetical protein
MMRDVRRIEVGGPQDVGLVGMKRVQGLDLGEDHILLQLVGDVRLLSRHQ